MIGGIKTYEQLIFPIGSISSIVDSRRNSKQNDSSNHSAPDTKQPNPAVQYHRVNPSNNNAKLISPNNLANSSRPKSKKRLKLATSSGYGFSDTVEWVMVFLILNTCFVMAIKSSIMIAVLYILLANFVVGRTLLLRASRVIQSVSSAAPSAPANMNIPNNDGRNNQNIPNENILEPSAAQPHVTDAIATDGGVESAIESGSKDLTDSKKSSAGPHQKPIAGVS